MAAFSNNLIHVKLGQRGIAFLGPFFHLLAFTVLAVHPPYPVLVVFLVGAGFGTGCLDAAWCAWTGNMVSANKVQGFLQSFYSLGAALGPFLATSIIAPDKGGRPWYQFFYIMVWLYFSCIIDGNIETDNSARLASPSSSSSFALGLSGTRLGSSTVKAITRVQGAKMEACGPASKTKSLGWRLCSCGATLVPKVRSFAALQLIARAHEPHQSHLPAGSSHLCFVCAQPVPMLLASVLLASGLG